MSTNSYNDHWLLPRHQTEYPARDLLSETTLHGRREATHLVLVAMFFVATTALFVLGASRIIDVSALLARVAPAVELPTALLLPLGVVPFALSFIASALVCELFGRRRASALIWVGLFASVGVVALMDLADVIDGGETFGMSLALGACYLLAHASNLVLFDAARRRAQGRRLFIRIFAASLVAQAIGWTAFGFVLELGGGYVLAPIARETIMALSIGAAASSLAIVLVLAIPAALITRGLAIALRVGHDVFADDTDDDDDDRAYDDHSAYADHSTYEDHRAYDTDRDAIPAHVAHPHEAVVPWSRTLPGFAQGSVARRLPPAMIVDDDDVDHENLARRRAARASVQPFSSAEMRFFSEGDAATD